MTRMLAEVSGAPFQDADRISVPLSSCLEEVTAGIGPDWYKYRVLGATREGLALAKDPVGKRPERYKPVVPGTIFYNPMRILIGSIAMLDEGEEPGITSPDYVVFRTREGILHHKFFYYWLRSTEGAQFIRRLARGAVRERMLFRRLSCANITIPSWKAQVRFARQMALVERAREAADKQYNACRALAVSILASVFNSDIARGWPRRRIGDFADTCSGATPSRSRADYYDGEIPWVKTAELVDNEIVHAAEYVTEIALQETSLRLLPEGTLLVAMYGQGQTRGRTGLLRIAATINQACFAILPNPVVFDSQFLQYWFRSNYYRIRELSEGRGGNQSNLSGDFLKAMEIPFPHVEEQAHIVKMLKIKLAAAEKLETASGHAVQVIQGLPNTLLRASFLGNP